MIWFRKKQNLLLVIEMFVSFLLLFGLLCNVTNNMLNYYTPLGFDYEDVITVNLEIWSSGTSDEENLIIMDQLKTNMASLPGVLELTNTSSNIPYVTNTASSSLKYKDRSCGNPNRVKTDDDFQKVLGIELKEGRWYNQSDEGAKEIPIVINQKLKDILFEDESAVGAVIHSGMYNVVGVVENYKIKGEFSKESPTYFTRYKPGRFEEVFLLKAEKDSGIELENRLTKTISAIAKDWTMRIQPLSDHRRDNFKRRWIPVLVFSIICLFFIINIILGLYGILWYNISKRRSEIGLRQSVGATKVKIYNQFIFEMIVLATLGIIPGIIVAIQFPVLKVFELETKVYIIAILLASIIVYILVVLSAFLPSMKASKVQPALALHEE